MILCKYILFCNAPFPQALESEWLKCLMLAAVLLDFQSALKQLRWMGVFVSVPLFMNWTVFWGESFGSI